MATRGPRGKTRAKILKQIAGTKLRASRGRPILIHIRMKLSDLLAGAGAIEPVASAIPADVEVQAVAYDSRQVTQGSLFVAIRGEKADGNAYVPEAISKGATVIVSEAPRSADLAGTNETVWIQVTHARKALATIAANFYSRSADQLQLVGIT